MGMGDHDELPPGPAARRRLRLSPPSGADRTARLIPGSLAQSKAAAPPTGRVRLTGRRAPVYGLSSEQRSWRWWAVLELGVQAVPEALPRRLGASGDQPGILDELTRTVGSLVEPGRVTAWVWGQGTLQGFATGGLRCFGRVPAPVARRVLPLPAVREVTGNHEGRRAGAGARRLRRPRLRWRPYRHEPSRRRRDHSRRETIE